LAEFSPIRRLFTLSRFFKMKKVPNTSFHC
jgi:hypothetical protein